MIVIDVRKKSCLRFLAGLSAICIPSLASAQSGDRISSLEDMSDNQALSGQAQNAPIIVTAQRRSERALDVPISLTSVESTDLGRAGISDLRSLPQLVPGLLADQTGVIFQPAVRGISSATTGFGFEASVAIYVDGVYYPSTNSNMQDFPDVERIEVSRGPQGTLFGRNAVGGAIRVITKSPNVTTPEIDAELTVGTKGIFDTKVYASTPLGGDFAISIAASHAELDGYHHDIFRDTKAGGVNSDFVRGKLRYEPEWGDIVLSGFYRDRTDVQPFSQAPLNDNTVGRAIDPTAILPNKAYDIAHDVDDDLNVESYGFTANASFDLGFATLTSITAYLNSLTRIRNDSDASPVPVQSFQYGQRDTSFSQEFNLSSDDTSSFRWVIGAYYFDANSDWEEPLEVLFNNAVVASIYNRVPTEAIAVYGQADFDLSERLTITGGLRYSYEKKKLFGAVNAPGENFYNKDSWNSVTPRVAMRYEVSPYSNIYASWSRGFKSGGFNTNGAPSESVDPEEVDAFELGYKTQDGGLMFNAAAYYYLIRDLQVGVLRVLNTTENAATARSYGVELDGSYQLTDELRVGASFSYLNSRYRRYEDASLLVPRGTGGNMAISADASGNHTIRSPEFTVGGVVSYRRETSAGKVTFDSNIFYNDGFFFEAGNRVRQPSYFQLNGEIGFEPTENWRISAWVRNLLDEKYALANVVSTNVDSVALAPPLTVGATVRFTY